MENIQNEDREKTVHEQSKEKNKELLSIESFINQKDESVGSKERSQQANELPKSCERLSKSAENLVQVLHLHVGSCTKNVASSNNEIESEYSCTGIKPTCSIPFSSHVNATSNMPISSCTSMPSTSGGSGSCELDSPAACSVSILKRPLKKQGKFIINKVLKPDVEPEVENLIEGMKDDIDEVLERTAKKNKLTARNVRNILRHVITNEHVLAMVWNTMNSEKDGNEVVPEAFYEPKLTRSKFRQLKKGQNNDSASTKPDENPNQKMETTKLLVEEFPENESSDDDFEPTAEVDEESDEDDLNMSIASSNIGSPDVSNASVQIPSIEHESASAHSEDETRLVIEETEKPNEFTLSPVVWNKDTISLRTRSKLPLDDTPLESIEAEFIAPDITTDMYDSDCDDEDWKSFLNDFCKPLQQSAEPVDDEVNDPEYNFLEDDQEMTDQWDLRSDRAVKVTKKELNELITELLEAAEQDIEEDEEDDQNLVLPIEEEKQENILYGPESKFLSREMTAVLEEQMRMHVQLLSQTFVLTHNDPRLSVYNDSCRTLLFEINDFSKKKFPDPNRKSAFAAHNLPDALDLIEKLDCKPLPVINVANKKPSVNSRDLARTKPIPKDFQNLFAKSSAFIYPQLLPIVCLKWDPVNFSTKPFFSPAEDQLIAYGLEQFSPIKEFHVTELIRKHMIPIKSERNIKLRIKNGKQSKNADQNPIAFYFKHNKAPQIPVKLPNFDPSQAVAPFQRRPSVGMPTWMSSYLRHVVKKISISPSASPVLLKIKPANKSAENVSTTPTSRHLPPILPRIQRTSTKLNSPMKHATSILKKYGVRNSKLVFRGPLNFLSPAKSPLKYRSLVPKPVASNANCVENQQEQTIKPTKLNFDIMGAQSDTDKPKSVAEEAFANTPSPELISCIEEGNNDAGSQSEIDTCEEGEDIEDEVIDKEVDLAALMEASSTICKKNPPNIKKKKKHERELESLLPLLADDLIESDPQREARETAFVNAYFQKIIDTLGNDVDTLESYLYIMHEFQNSNRSAVELYHDISKVFHKYPALVDEFVAFLLPEQAKECNRLNDHLLFRQSQLFLRKLEVTFHHPQQLQKIVKLLARLQKEPGVTSESIHAALNPFLRNRGHLLEELSLLIPDDSPPDELMTDFEEFQLPDSDSEMENDESDVEEIFIPETEDPYGSKDCPCNCHSSKSDLRMQRRKRHCVKCGLRFIDGRIFLQTGKVLKPAHVICHSKLKLSDFVPKAQSDSPLMSCDSNEDKVSSETLYHDVLSSALAENSLLGVSDIACNESYPEMEVEDPLDDLTPVVRCNSPKWSKEEDALLLKTCQKLNATDDESETAFEQVRLLLKSRSLTSIKDRFKELLNLFMAQKSDDDMESGDESG